MNKCKLGDLFYIKQGYAFKSEKYVSHSNYILCTLANFSESNNFKLMISMNMLLIYASLNYLLGMKKQINEDLMNFYGEKGTQLLKNFCNHLEM